jgi:RNA polymerase sigma-70 factor (ECF subfamily)
MMTSQASQAPDRFATTRWSMVMQLADKDSALARDALGDLAQRYWYPVYAYVRQSGQPPATAADVTRHMLQRIVRDSASGHAPNASRHYRNYLLERVRSLLDGDWTTIIGEEIPASAEFAAPDDLENRYQHDHAAKNSPEQAFQRSFALVVLRRTLQRLRDEAARSGRADMCRALEPYLVRDPASTDFDRLAVQLRTRKVALILGLKRLRHRLRELAAQELADTVSSAEDLESEQDALLAILDEVNWMK